MTKSQKNIKIIRDILDDEIRGDVESALEKMHQDYSMAWIYKRRDGALFPRVSAKDVHKTMGKVYKIKNRKYKIINIVANDKTVIAEIIESYPDPKTKKVYRTPMVIVWEFKNGKIKTGRHYCDPQLSSENLSENQIRKIYK